MSCNKKSKAGHLNNNKKTRLLSFDPAEDRNLRIQDLGTARSAVAHRAGGNADLLHDGVEIRLVVPQRATTFRWFLDGRTVNGLGRLAPTAWCRSVLGELREFPQRQPEEMAGFSRGHSISPIPCSSRTDRKSCALPTKGLSRIPRCKSLTSSLSRALRASRNFRA